MVHEKVHHIPSLMITGPHGVGKKMLLQAICTEVGVNLFDLTPANIADRYPGKAGLNMLLHMVFKVNSRTQINNVYVNMPTPFITLLHMPEILGNTTTMYTSEKLCVS